MPSTEYLLSVRDAPKNRNDRGLRRAIDADLERRGYRESPEPAAREMETAVPPEMEKAVPEKPRRGGRPKLPRCEHDQIADRCPICNDDAVA